MRICCCKGPCKRSQHCWPTRRNIVGPNMLRAFAHQVVCCCVLLRLVGSCWMKFESGQTSSNNFQQVATTRNNTQHGVQTLATCWAQQCCVLLANNVASVCTGLKHAHYLMSESPPSCFTEKVWNQKKGNYEICARLCAYTCVEGVLAFAMLMLMPVLMLHKKS